MTGDLGFSHLSPPSSSLCRGWCLSTKAPEGSLSPVWVELGRCRGLGVRAGFSLLYKPWSGGWGLGKEPVAVAGLGLGRPWGPC